MSDAGDRGNRPGGQRPDRGRRDDSRPSRGEPAGGRPRRDDDARPRRDGDSRPRREGDSAPRRDGDARPRRDGDARPRRDGDSRPRRDGDSRPPKDGERRLWTKGGAPARGDRDARERETPEDRDPFGTRSVRAHHEAPPIPEGIEPKDLDRIARNELKTLSKENADGVALHLVMAAKLIDEDPQLAHQHAISASRRAGRIGVVRETLAITAYAVGDYALALRELRTHRRITGSNDHLPMMVDSERGMGRPEKALEEGRSVPRASLPVAVQVELAIAMSGARLDLGQADAALKELEIPQLDPTKAFSYSPDLFAAYATVLEDLGREAEAEQWWSRADQAADVLGEATGSDDDTIEVVEEELPQQNEEHTQGEDDETSPKAGDE